MEWPCKYPPPVLQAMERVVAAAQQSIGRRASPWPHNLRSAVEALEVALAQPVSCCDGTVEGAPGEPGRVPCRAKAYLGGEVNGAGCGDACRWICEKGGHGNPPWP